MIRRKLVSWSGAAATLVLLLVATPCVFAQDAPKAPDGLHEALDASVAAQFAAMQKLSARFSTPEAAGQLVDVLVARDAAAFNKLVGDLDLPLGGTCWWAYEMVEKAFRVDGSKEKDCTLRDNLTPAELALYIQIAIKHGMFGPSASATSTPPVLDFTRQILIVPGPFRDELEANGLLVCKPVQNSSSIATRPVVGKPFYFCLEDGPHR
jgi:hypothetical protein